MQLNGTKGKWIQNADFAKSHFLLTGRCKLSWICVRKFVTSCRIYCLHWHRFVQGFFIFIVVLMRSPCKQIEKYFTQPHKASCASASNLQPWQYRAFGSGQNHNHSYWTHSMHLDRIVPSLLFLVDLYTLGHSLGCSLPLMRCITVHCASDLCLRLLLMDVVVTIFTLMSAYSFLSVFV